MIDRSVGPVSSRGLSLVLIGPVHTAGVRSAGRLSPEQFWAHVTELDDRVRAVADVLPCYGLAGWTGPRMYGDWSFEDGRLVTAGLAHGWLADGLRVQVLSTLRDSLTLVSTLRAQSRGIPRSREEAVQRQREMHTGPAEHATVVVEASPVPFRLWRDGDLWWAAGVHAGHDLVLEAQGVDVGEVELTRVHDLEPYIAGRRALLRDMRGGT